MVSNLNIRFQNLRSTVADLISPKSKLVTKPIGTSGTEIFNGFFDEEKLAKLVDERGIEIFDQMRRSDGQVRMLLSVVKNPIKSATWGIVPVDDSDEEKEKAAFIEHIFFNDMGFPDESKVKTFSEFIAEALTFSEFGYSVFEIIHKVVENHPRFGTYIGLADLAFRHQKTIFQWHLNQNGSIKSIRQFVPSGDLSVDVEISGQNIIVFTIDKEGDNYQGISMLRPIYGNWFRKDFYRKIQAIGIERAAKGVPVGKIPAEILNRNDYEEQRQATQDVLDALSSHETNAVVLGAGFELEEFKQTHDAEKVQKVIMSENVEMTKSFLANFMELGLENNSGSFALGSDLSDIFLSGLQCHAKLIEERIDIQLIRPLIKAKFGPQEFYPKIKATGINDKAGKELAEIVKILVETGLLAPSDMLESHLAKLYKLPSPDRENEDDDSGDEDNGDDPDSRNEDTEETELSDHRKKDKKKSNHKDKKDCCSNTDSDHVCDNDCDCGAEFDAAYQKLKKNVLDDMGIEDSTLLSKFEIDSFDEKLYAAAAKDIRFASAIPSVFITRQAEPLDAAIRAMLLERSDRMIATMANIFKTEKNRDKARTRGLDQRLPDKKAFKDMFKASTGDTANKALDNVLKELGATRDTFKLADDIGDLPKSMQKAILAEALLTAEFLDVDLEKVVLFTFNLNFDQTDSAAVIKQELTIQRDKFMTPNRTKTAATNVTSKVTNSVRNDVFQSPDVLEEIESFVFVNPNPISAICQNLTGRVFSKEEYATTPFLPPLHHNCKSTIRAQRTKARNKLPVDGTGLRPTGTDIEIQKALKSVTI